MQKRLKYLLSFLLVVALGLFSRNATVAQFVPFSVGDALYAVMIYLGLSVVLPSAHPAKRAVFALLFCVAIEGSQLLEWPWLQQLRQNKFARLVLGQGFLWGDMLAYLIGVVAAFGLDSWFEKAKQD